MRRFLIAVSLAYAACAAATYPPAPEQRARIASRLEELSRACAALRGADELWPDVAVYEKAARWLLRFDEWYTPAHAASTLAVLDRGLARARELASGKPSWPNAHGRLSRAYRSRIDGSLQPYGLIVPDAYDGKRPVRLDVVLHGRGATLNEVSFLAAHDRASPLPAGQDFIQLDVFGRGNNAYRWSGETDVFEAIESVTRRYRIDPDRIVLRGFSMGGAGAWHLGLHHPDRWAAFEAGAGFVETTKYAKLSNLPAWQTATLHIYDALDYAANAFDVPLVGYGGEIDPQLEASRSMREEMARLGVKGPLFLVGPGTAHKFHPDSKRESDAYIDRAAAAGRRDPDRIQFVTWTPRYNRCFWIAVDALERQYERAQISAQRTREQIRIDTRNVARLTVERGNRTLSIDGAPVAAGTCFEKRGAAWTPCGRAYQPRKTHGLQGPIDDAFMEAFLCVRPTGRPKDDAVNGYALKQLERFRNEYARFFRADAPVKDDRDVTRDDIAARHLVLFGDPGSNRVLARIAAKLPLKWEAGVVPVLVYPNPLNPRRYVVLNSGHTFGEKDLLGTNALLFPRLGDWARIRAADGAVMEAGLFDANWR